MEIDVLLKKRKNHASMRSFDLSFYECRRTLKDIGSLCKNNAISKVLNKLQVFRFRCTVHTNTTPTVIPNTLVRVTKTTVLQR